MGGKNSREEAARYRHSSSFQSTSSFSNYPPQPSYSLPPQGDQNYPFQDPNPQQYTSLPIYTPQKKLDKKYSRIADSYNSLEQVINNLTSPFVLSVDIFSC